MPRSRFVPLILFALCANAAYAQAPSTIAAEEALRACAFANVPDAIAEHDDIAQAANHAINACPDQRELLRAALLDHYMTDYPESAARLADHVVTTTIEDMAPSLIIAVAEAKADG